MHAKLDSNVDIYAIDKNSVDNENSVQSNSSSFNDQVLFSTAYAYTEPIYLRFYVQLNYEDYFQLFSFKFSLRACLYALRVFMVILDQKLDD